LAGRLFENGVRVKPKWVTQLVDFEGSIFGHTGLDAAFLHYPFPTYSAHWAVMPDEVLFDADQAYRLELAEALPFIGVAHFDEMLAVGAAAARARCIQRLKLLARPGQTPHDRWHRRSQLVQQVRVFERLATRANCLHALLERFCAALAGEDGPLVRRR